MRRRALPLAITALLALPATAAATFPGTNGRIVYDNSAMFSVLPDGTGMIQLDNPADTPGVSADGNLIAYRKLGTGANGIWVVNPDGSGAHQISETSGVAANDVEPAFSPDGSQIAFTRNNDLFVMNSDGSGATNLTSAFSPAVTDPDWRPQGDEIVFGCGFQICVLPPTGGTPLQVNPVASGNRSNPSWSPDGTRIAFSFGAAGSIAVIDRATAPNETEITGDLGEMWDLAWSPDGTKIGFILDVTGPLQEELWTMNADGTGVTRLNVDTGTSMEWGPQGTFQPPPPPSGLPAPVLGESVNVTPVSGTVLIGLPGGSARAGARAAQKGVQFVPLTEGRQVPVGSFLDTKKGTVSLTSAADAAGATQAGSFSKGLFQILQARNAKRGLTELRLKGSSFSNCRAAGRGKGKRNGRRESATAAARKRLKSKTVRRLSGNADGAFRTRGKHSSATIRGTVWTMSDRCDGTLTKVKRGKVAVRDFRRKKTIVVKAGKRYLAKAPGA